MMFVFLTDEQSYKFCHRIVVAMQLLYDIQINVAIELVNDYFFGCDWRAVSNGGTSEHYKLLYHEPERNWAERIGNPRPLTKGREFDIWAIRQAESENRIREYRHDHLYDWLYI